MTVPFSYSRSISQQVVESRVESVLWQDNGRIHWCIIISLIRGRHAANYNYTKNCKCSIRLRTVHAASIDYCRRPSAIVCDMETKFATRVSYLDA